MNKLFFAAGAFLLAVSSGVSAQSFQGPFVGLQGGWNHDKVAAAPWDGSELKVEKSKHAPAGSLVLGYDQHLAPNVVVGLEAGLTATAKDKIVRSESGASLEVDPKYSLEASARGGYLLDPSTMVYARGGYTNLRTVTELTGKDGTLRHKANLDGWMAGAGVERLFTANVSGRVEYRYSDFSGNGGDVKRHQVFVGAAYRF
jgi:outer membrane immunogenic protein